MIFLFGFAHVFLDLMQCATDMSCHVEQIHAASLRILETCGLRLYDADLVALLKRRGFSTAEKVVKFSQKQIETALSHAPGEFILHGRDGCKSVTIGNNSRILGSGYGAATVIDGGVNSRPATMKDYLRVAKLAQANDILDISGGALVWPTDVPPEHAGLLMIYAALLHGDKPILGTQDSERNVERMIHLAAAALGGKKILHQKPHILFLINSFPPLQYDKQALGTIKAAARAKQPLIITPGIIMGMSGPILPVGSLVQANAEFLAGLCIAQQLEPGLPVVYAAVAMQSNFYSGDIVTTSPVRHEFYALAAQLAEKYNLPNRGIGAVSDADYVSVQSGYESLYNLICDFRYRTSLVVHAAGMLKRLSAFSFEKFIIDLELYNMLLSQKSNTKIDDEQLSINEIMEAGHGGTFLTSRQTLKYCRSVPYFSKIAPKSCSNAHDYMAALHASVDQRLNELLKNGKRPNLDPKVKSVMRKCLQSYGLEESLIQKAE